MIDSLIEKTPPFANQDKGKVVKPDIEQPITDVLKQEPTLVASNQAPMKPGKDDTTIRLIKNITDKPFPGTPGAEAKMPENQKPFGLVGKTGPDNIAAVRQPRPLQKAA